MDMVQGDLLDALIQKLPTQEEGEELGLPKLAVVGRPNVGKSTLINTLLGEERNIVTDIAGTTRDSVHTRFNAFGFDFEIVDTAGLRKRKKVDDNLEFYSAVRTVKAIDQSDVCCWWMRHRARSRPTHFLARARQLPRWSWWSTNGTSWRRMSTP